MVNRIDALAAIEFNVQLRDRQTETGEDYAYCLDFGEVSEDFDAYVAQKTEEEA